MKIFSKEDEVILGVDGDGGCITKGYEQLWFFFTPSGDLIVYNNYQDFFVTDAKYEFEVIK